MVRCGFRSRDIKTESVVLALQAEKYGQVLWSVCIPYKIAQAQEPNVPRAETMGMVMMVATMRMLVIIMFSMRMRKTIRMVITGKGEKHESQDDDRADDSSEHE